MAYYVRLFSKSRERIPLGPLRDLSACRQFVFHLEAGSDERWDDLLVTTGAGEKYCVLDRIERDVDSLFADELKEHLELLVGAKPEPGAQWVRDYLAQTNTIYATRYLSAAFGTDRGLPSPADILWSISSVVGGILQADGESISNEEGYAVVLQFGGDAEGEWAVALLEPDGTWKTGRIELSEGSHIAAFESGVLPAQGLDEWRR
jgi:hypothetical protein